MIKATQKNINEFVLKAEKHDNVWPYFSIIRWTREKKVFESDWFGVQYINESNTCLLWVDFNRNIDLEFNVSLWSLNKFASGKALKLLETIIDRYKPSYINTCVLSSNTESILINRRMFGDEIGIEKMGGWNLLKGCREDLYLFRCEASKVNF